MNPPASSSVVPPGPRVNGQSRLERHLAGYESASTVMSSELDTTSFCDSDDDDTMSRFSSSTEQSTASRLLKRHRRRRKQRPPRLERVSAPRGRLGSYLSWIQCTVFPLLQCVHLAIQ